jgi:hypothetical protein
MRFVIALFISTLLVTREFSFEFALTLPERNLKLEDGGGNQIEESYLFKRLHAWKIDDRFQFWFEFVLHAHVWDGEGIRSGRLSHGQD